MADKEVKEQSVYNMSKYLFERQHNFLTKCHEIHDAAINGQLNLLPSCLSAFKHSYILTKWALQQKDRKEIDRELKEYSELLQTTITKYPKPGTIIPYSEWNKLIDGMFELIDLLYHAQQNVNLGLTKEVVLDDEAKLYQSGEEG